MTRASTVFHRVVLILSAMGALGAAAWIGFRLFEPVAIPPIPPPKPAVSFDKRADIRNNPLFGGLRTVLRGEVEAGTMGRRNPFSLEGIALTAGSAGGISPALGSSSEVSLGGASALAISRAKDGAMLVLVGGAGSTNDDYEVRRYAVDQEPTVVARWKLQGIPRDNVLPEALIPVAFQQDGFGGIRLLSQGGHLGSLQSDGTPSWASTPLFTDTITNDIVDAGSVVLDGSGRVWVSNGHTIVYESDTGFTTIKPDTFITEDQRAKLLSAPPSLWRLQPLQNGGMAVYSSRMAVLFSLDMREPPNVIVADGSIVSVAQIGDVWSFIQDPGGASRWVRQNTVESQVYPDPVVFPKQAATDPHTMVSGLENQYALDYTPQATIYWKHVNGAWAGEVVTASGVQPTDTVRKTTVDGQGNLWAILSQKGMLLVRPAAQ